MFTSNFVYIFIKNLLCDFIFIIKTCQALKDPKVGDVIKGTGGLRKILIPMDYSGKRRFNRR